MDDLALYVSGQRPELIDNYPEFEVYRDVVFWLKFFSSTAQLPEAKVWFQKDSRLTWRFSDGYFSIRAFGRELKPEPPAEAVKEASHKGSFLAQLFKSSRPRSTIRGGADASSLCGTRIESEEDVLHIRELPNFDGRLTQSNSELLLSYLTVPYIRIPLVLNFFAAPENLSALCSPTIQRVFDCVMFEPGLWLPPGELVQPDTVPAPDRAHLATPCGLLFNELQCSPQAVVASLLNLLNHAIELDTGRWTERAAATILYVVRLVVRVEGFLVFMIQHHLWDNSQMNRTGWASKVRGLDTDDTGISALRGYRHRLRTLLNLQIRPMFQSWIQHGLKRNELGKVAILYAHSAFLWQNLTEDELSSDVVVHLLSSQLFITTRYRSQAETQNAVQTKASLDAPCELLVPENDLFDMFQKHRGMLLK